MLWVLLAGSLPLAADQPLPANVLDPQSVAEAWNVIRLATQNVELLIREKRFPEIARQVSYCSPSLRTLVRLAPDAAARAALTLENRAAFQGINAVVDGAAANDLERLEKGFAQLRAELNRMARHFDAKVVVAEIFACPMHPEVIAEKPATPCAQCGTTLIPRRIPYSFVYTRPGEPTLRLTARSRAPVKAGQENEVTVRLEKPDGSPVLPVDLMELHANRIHLLIQEPGLGDYHHEHPQATATPGEYAFAFRPRKTAPYRIWADVAPVATGIQELPFVDLPAATPAHAFTAATNRLEDVAEGYRFVLTFPGTERDPITAGATRFVAVTVTDPAGRPVTTLEPFMNAFAHLVGFYGDFQTVVHLHPRGGDVLNPEFRGGPALSFNFFPPRQGLVRLYCQVRLGGRILTASFDVNVEPYCAPPVRK